MACPISTEHSVAITISCLLPELGEVLEVVGVGLSDAPGVVDGDVGPAQGEEREGHGHAVVVVGAEDDGGG